MAGCSTKGRQTYFLVKTFRIPGYTVSFQWLCLGQDKRDCRVFLNVTIINCNYDRLIEQYIYSELRTRLDVSPHDAAQTVARLKMIRPYGSVSPLPSFGGQISFGQNLPDEIDNLPRLSFGIITFTEQNMSASYQSIY
jgi:hypothetical protein